MLSDFEDLDHQFEGFATPIRLTRRRQPKRAPEVVDDPPAALRRLRIQRRPAIGQRVELMGQLGEATVELEDAVDAAAGGRSKSSHQALRALKTERSIRGLGGTGISLGGELELRWRWNGLWVVVEVN